MSIDPNDSKRTPLPGGIHTVAGLVEAARRHGLRLTSEQDTLDETGLDFLVLHARDEDGVPWIVRAPRRPDVVAAARVEASALRVIAPRMAVRVPQWRIADDDVIAYPRLDGTPVVTIGETGPIWNVIDRSAPAETFLGSFASALAALQAIPVEDARAAGISVKTVAEARDDLVQAAERTRAVLAPPEAVWSRWHRWLESDATWPAHVALVHGDLHPGHMLVDAEGKLVGILDWTEVQVTDPSVDLAMFFGCFGKAALDALLARFERAGGKTWPGIAEHAAERWAIFAVVGADWSARTGNEAALEHARWQLSMIAGETE